MSTAARDHSETGFGSSWFGAPKRYPPRPPSLARAAARGERVLLEWIGSYDRDGDFRDYNVLITDRDGKLIHEEAVVTPYLELTLPREEGLRFTVEAARLATQRIQDIRPLYYTKPQAG